MHEANNLQTEITFVKRLHQHLSKLQNMAYEQHSDYEPKFHSFWLRVAWLFPSHNDLTLTVDTASFITVVRTVVNFITLFGAMDTGTITALELIRSTSKQGWET